MIEIGSVGGVGGVISEGSRGVLLLGRLRAALFIFSPALAMALTRALGTALAFVVIIRGHRLARALGVPLPGDWFDDLLPGLLRPVSLLLVLALGLPLPGL